MDDQTNQPISSPPTEPVIPSDNSTDPAEPIISPAQQPILTQPAPEEDKIVQIGKYKVQVVRHLCIGAATCIAISAPTFQLDSENKAVVQPQSTDSPENILMAAQSCPTKAIIITDTETGQQIWPE